LIIGVLKSFSKKMLHLNFTSGIAYTLAPQSKIARQSMLINPQQLTKFFRTFFYKDDLIYACTPAELLQVQKIKQCEFKQSKRLHKYVLKN